MINFEKLEVYQDSIVLATMIYNLTKKFPKEELFGIVNQLRRASVSIALNIAEGSSRGRKEFAHFLDMARGSCYELVPLIRISLDLKYITNEDYENSYASISNLAMRISALKNSLNR